jgi:hypothetical protein
VLLTPAGPALQSNLILFLPLSKYSIPNDSVSFYGDAAVFASLYHSNLVRFIHRFPLSISVKDLLLADVDRQRIITFIQGQVTRRRLFVYLICGIGICCNLSTLVLELRHFSGVNIKFTELLKLTLAGVTTAMYVWLIVFYRKTKSRKFTPDDDEIFEPLERFVEEFTYVGNVSLFPDISFKIQSMY